MSTLSFQDYVRERMMRKRQEAMLADGGESETPPTANKMRAAPVAARTTQTPSVPKKAAKPQGIQLQGETVSKGILDELHAMREMMEDRFSALAWLGQARQDPIQANLMLKLIRAGYSPNLARTVLEKLPGLNAADSVHWVVDILERNLRTDAEGPLLHEEGGVSLWWALRALAKPRRQPNWRAFA